MEDRLEEAIHVLRSHAVGQPPGIPDMHSLLSAASGAMAGLSQAFSNPGLPLSNRHPAMVSAPVHDPTFKKSAGKSNIFVVSYL